MTTRHDARNETFNCRQRKKQLSSTNQALQPALCEMFFTSRLVLVEGLEDVAYITSYMHLLGLWDEYRRMGSHIVPVNGKSELLQPLIVAKHMGIPTFLAFDADADKPDRNGSRAKHERDNRSLLAAVGEEGAIPFPAAPFWHTGCVMWHSDIGAIVSNDIGQADWQVYQNQADVQYGQAGGLHKNALHIGASLALAWDAGKRSPNLDRLCREIINPASSVQ